MPRSLKKGPFVDGHLLKKIDASERERREEGRQTWSAAPRSSPTWSATRSLCTTAASTSRSTSPRRWSATSWASSPQPVPSGSMLARERGLVADGWPQDQRDVRGTRRPGLARHALGLQGPRGPRPDPRQVVDERRDPAVLRPGLSEVILKVLESAVANAEHNDEHQPPKSSIVSACYADEGPTLKRWRPRARGRATRIRKRTCHVTVIS